MRRREFILAGLFMAVLIAGFAAIGLKDGVSTPPRTVTRTVTRTVIVTPPPKIVIRYRPRPAAVPAPAPTVTHESFYVNCFKQQCTSLPGAGPDGTTCTWPPSTGEQLCTK